MLSSKEKKNPQIKIIWTRAIAIYTPNGIKLIV